MAKIPVALNFVVSTMIAARKEQLAQYFTNKAVANFMASRFRTPKGDVSILDPGAGGGALTSALLSLWKSRKLRIGALRAVLYEVDKNYADLLPAALSHVRLSNLTTEVHCADFLNEGVRAINRGERLFTHCIVNPPYKKISSASEERKILSEVDIETVNLYSAFVSVAIKLLKDDGEIVAIIPRSFCNGPYYLPFRKLILGQTSLKSIHLFNSRNKAFKNDGVLQENVIIHLVRDGRQGAVTISTSTDDTFFDLSATEFEFSEIVHPEDRELFFHIPTKESINSNLSGTTTLSELGISVSTGPVVDFRTAGLCDQPITGSFPLLYPVHFNSSGINWPDSSGKKPNAIRDIPENRKWLMPNGNFCIVRRFTSKEERRRIVAHFIPSDAFSRYEFIGFENHLNVFHVGKKGLDPIIARGLSTFLNTTIVDMAFRNFSGHTQVNVTDLKKLRYPSLSIIRRLGEWACQNVHASQSEIDAAYASVTSEIAA